MAEGQQYRAGDRVTISSYNNAGIQKSLSVLCVCVCVQVITNTVKLNVYLCLFVWCV